MNRKELVQRIAGAMRENCIRKPVSIKKQVFHISDDDGNSKDFVIKKTDKLVPYTIDDVESILDMCGIVIKEALKSGDNVSIHGFGTFDMRYQKGGRTKHPATGEPIQIRSRYVTKFSPGKDLRMCAKIRELSADDRLQELPDICDLEEFNEDGDCDANRD